MSEESKDKETAEAATGESVSTDNAEAEPGPGKPEKASSADAADAEQEAAKSEEAEEQHAAPAAAAAIKPDDRAPPQPAAASRRGTSPLSWLALFLSLAALAAAGYMVVEDHRARALEEASSDSLDRLAGRLDESRDSIASLDDRLGTLASSDETLESRIDSLRSDLDDRADILDSLPGRMSNLENSVAALQGASAGARDTWLLAEAEYYMQIANAQLQLGKNPRLAMLALEMADERVVQMANPALTDVRRTLADELAALEAMEKPDVQGATLTLASLARVVDSLPLRVAGEAADAAAGPSAEDVGAAGRAWASVKEALYGLVKVTPPDEDKRAMLTPDAAQMMRSNLALQLQAARLALLRGEQAVFEQSLDDADALLDQYFDSSSAQVSSAQDTIAEIRDSMVAVTAPDISESLRLIRQFRTLSESAQ
jgi:uroporphyrin-3 C-methyltransferase